MYWPSLRARSCGCEPRGAGAPTCALAGAWARPGVRACPTAAPGSRGDEGRRHSRRDQASDGAARVVQCAPGGGARARLRRL